MTNFKYAIKLLVMIPAIILIAASCNNNTTPQTETNLRSNSEDVQPKITPLPTPTPTLKPKSNCDSNYSGCVPIASDVDCAGGSGNGPAYVRGPVSVLGSDIYDLDRDGDGIACE
jgi:hypothetical protein